jgi:hypothetical protein
MLPIVLNLRDRKCLVVEERSPRKIEGPQAGSRHGRGVARAGAPESLATRGELILSDGRR